MGRNGWNSAGLALVLLVGCAISRVDVGAPIEEERLVLLEVGVTDEVRVLDLFGAPNEVLRHPDGDIFVYRFVRRDSRTLTIEEPIVTNFEIFSWSRVEEHEDRFVVLFDEEGVVASFGFHDGVEDDENDGESP